MKFLYGEPDFPHEKGEFCVRAKYNYYSFYCFLTPFLYEKDGVLLKGEAGDILINAPDEVVYHGPVSPEHSFTNDWIHAEGDDLKGLMEKYPIPSLTPFRHPNPHLIKNAVVKIRRELALKRHGYKDKINCIFTELIIELHRISNKMLIATTPKGRIEAAREEVMQSPEKPWILENMAELSGYSPSRFSALYKEIFGISPKADLLKCRMELAESMLRYSGLSVSAIATACGFESIYYFSKYFKTYHGVAPTAYITTADT